MSPKKKTALPVVGYVRVSTNKQDISREAQEEQIRAMATVKGWELADVLVDFDEFSGDLDRPKVQEVLRLIEARKVQGVIVSKLDRLTRSTRDCVMLIDLCNKKDVSLVSLAESLDTKSPMGRFFVRMIASLAELERETIGTRTREAMAHLKKLGMPVGQAPYGWLAPQANRGLKLEEKARLVENPAEQKVIKEIVRLHKKGLAYRTIARNLNKSGYRTRRGTPWQFQYVARIIKESAA